MNFKSSFALPGVSLLGLLAALSADAADFSPGNLLVYRVGANTGSDTLANTGNAVFIDEWTTSGTYVQSVATGVFASGTATSEGMLNASPNGQYVAFTGYASTAATSLAGTTAAAVNRSVGVLSASGLQSRTNFSDYATGNNPRSAVTDNGTNLWMTGGAGGARYGTTAGGTSTQLSTTVTNLRSIEAFNGQLYTSTSSGSAVRVGLIGSGLPTTAGQTIANLPGFITSGSPYEFAFADLSVSVAGLDTLYVAEDTAGGGQIQKYSLVAGNWVASGSVTAAAVRGLTVSVSGATVSIFGSTGGSGAEGVGTVFGFTDSTGYSGTVSGTAAALFSDATLQAALGSAGNSFAFRGVEFVPVSAIPEPSAFAALAGGSILAGSALRRRRRA